MRPPRGAFTPLGGILVSLAVSIANVSSAAVAPINPSPADWARFSVLTPAGPEEPSAEVFRRLKRLVYGRHKVVKGEYSSWNLAKAYGTTPMSLQTTNGSEMMMLYPGMKVTIQNKPGMLYEVKRESVNLDEIRAAYQRFQKLRPDDFLRAIVDANELPGSALISDFELNKGDRILLPGVAMVWDTYHFPFASGGVPRISSRFGRRFHPLLKKVRMHEGLDLPKPYGTPVVPARNGQVIEAGWHEGYGLMVVLRHSDGWTTRYGHLSKIRVTVGELVKRGQTVIGNVGSTGISTGPHLHFEVRDRGGRPVNPGAKIGRR